MLYLDTSLLVAALTNEAETPRLQRWLGEQPAGDLAISDWVTTDFSAALSIKRRTGQIRADDRDEAAAVFARLAKDSFTVMLISRLHFQTAARFAERDSLALRAGDALHLAICGDHGATLCTLDQRLGDAGPVLGIATILL
jgi:predicted nucleic acid-binding protein